MEDSNEQVYDDDGTDLNMVCSDVKEVDPVSVEYFFGHQTSCSKYIIIIDQHKTFIMHH